MDRGAARSRKRVHQMERATETGQPGPSAINSSSSGAKPRGQVSQSKPRQAPVKPPPKKRELLDEAIRYRPKAVRTSAALIWSEAPFPVPPPKDVLAGVRRVDLAGSGLKDVSWLKGCEVTWLSLAGCAVEDGWDAVGSLSRLSVLNISNCGLKTLPEELGRLSNLKALVAMGNEWSSLSNDVMSKWPELNSLIISHSLNLTSLPPALADLYHLSKVTFSHCPKISANAIPDLSPLPLLRDVKMNNLPHLITLPSHISKWGTGDLSLAQKSQSTEPESSSLKRRGEGLEVLDLGNCSLPFTVIEPIFITPAKTAKPSAKVAWPHLRSLTLHSNPLATTHTNYSELLQASAVLPNLQIIDAKRVKERKRKGEISETKADRRAKERKKQKEKPTGANVTSNATMRDWGAKESTSNSQDLASTTKAADVSAEATPAVRSEHKRRRDDARNEESIKDSDTAAPKKAKKREKGSSEEKRAAKEQSSKKARTDAARLTQSEQTITAVDPIDASLDPSASAVTHSKSVQPKADYKYQVLEVSNIPKGEETGRAERRKKERKQKAKDKSLVGADVVDAATERRVDSGPVDLKAIYASQSAPDEEENGLGLGGW